LDRLVGLDVLASALYIAGMNQVDTGLLSVEILKALHAVEDRLEASLEPLGLSLAKLGVLAKLAAAEEPLPLGALAERLACVRSNITQLVDRLEADKLVVRSDDPRDRRSVRAALTPEGRARHVAGLAALMKAEKHLLARVPEHDRNSLLPLLQSLAAE
jgi:DNA-binding MarR family transcriptional regulator